MKRLTSKDLMIGDWVRIPGSDKNKRVSGLTMAHIRLFGDIFRTRTYEPVPITSEILKKNGFIGDCGDRFLIGDGWYIEYMFLDNILKIEKGTQDIFIEIKSVHELQHVLRLCDINKEIEL